jgi:DNA polymerase I-like protein with 3'-5' exonuclease and polymerase domains
VAIDIDATKAALQVFKDKSNECIKTFQETFPGTSVTVSTAKLTVLLRDVLGIELAACGDADLAPYDSYPAINALRTYRSLKKSVDYLSGMLLNERNGRVYTSMQQLNYAGFGRTASGKLSKKSTAKDGVNFQQCPNNIKGYPSIRKCFAVPENRSLIIADLSSAHARLAIEFSQDANGLDIYQSGKDIHLFTATGLANKQGYSWTYEEIAEIYAQGSSHPDYSTVKQLRTNAKPTLYQSINLAGAATIHSTALSQGIPMTLEDAKVASKVFKETYTDLVSYQYFLLGCSRLQSATIHHEGTNYGRIVSKCGRITHVKHLPDRFRSGTSPMAANVVSFAWTAVEATIMKLALAQIRYQGRLHPEWGMMIVNFTHDEINAECHESHAYEVSKCINDAMTNNLRKFTPSLAGCGDMGDIEDSICKSWNEK